MHLHKYYITIFFFFAVYFKLGKSCLPSDHTTEDTNLFIRLWSQQFIYLFYSLRVFPVFFPVSNVHPVLFSPPPPSSLGRKMPVFQRKIFLVSDPPGFEPGSRVSGADTLPITPRGGRLALYLAKQASPTTCCSIVTFCYTK